jgi:hypothetical protein
MDVPKRIVDVFVAAAANVVNVSGQKGDCTIQICRTPAASAAAIVFVAIAALAPSTMSPTRSRAGRRLGATCKPESFVTFSPPALLTYPISRTPELVIYHVLCYKT